MKRFVLAACTALFALALAGCHESESDHPATIEDLGASPLPAHEGYALHGYRMTLKDAPMHYAYLLERRSAAAPAASETVADLGSVAIPGRPGQTLHGYRVDPTGAPQAYVYLFENDGALTGETSASNSTSKTTTSASVEAPVLPAPHP